MKKVFYFFIFCLMIIESKNPNLKTLVWCAYILHLELHYLIKNRGGFQSVKNQEKRYTPDAWDLANRFVERITHGLDPLTQLQTVVKARGYLLEDAQESPNSDTENLFLSDNSDVGDVLTLHDLLVESGTGHILIPDYRKKFSSNPRCPPFPPLKRWPIMVTGEVTQERLVKIFADYCYIPDYDHPGFDPGKKSFRFFRKRRYGPKFPVLYLDPHIARLVKTFNAIGIGTVESCDGNYGKDVYQTLPENPVPHIKLRHIYDSVWFAILFHRSISDHNRCCEWRIGDSRFHTLTISSRENDPLDLYLEIQKVAETLYENRIALREMKDRFCQGLNLRNWKSRVEDEFHHRCFLSDPASQKKTTSGEFLPHEKHPLSQQMIIDFKAVYEMHRNAIHSLRRST